MPVNEPGRSSYRRDLAYIHDVGHGAFARSAATFLLRTLARAGKRRGRVVDLGCGSGLLAEEFVRAGYEVLGFDISPAMIQIARRRVPRAVFRAQSFLSARIPPCVCVTAVGEVFSYLFDEGNTTKNLRSLFERIHQALEARGLLIFDVAAPGRIPGSGPRWYGREGEDWAVVVEAEQDRRRNTLTRRITSFRRLGRFYRRDSEVHRLRLHRPGQLARLLREVGFSVRILPGYGRLRFVRGHFGLIARKNPTSSCPRSA